MSPSTTLTMIEIAAPSGSTVLRRGMAHLEPFNGSDTMVSVRASVDALNAAAPHEAILTVREGTNAVWTRTITIPGPRVTKEAEP